MSPAASSHISNDRKYVGEVTHKGAVYPGEHDAIISRKLWGEVQEILGEHHHQRSARTRCKTPAPLARRGQHLRRGVEAAQLAVGLRLARLDSGGGPSYDDRGLRCRKWGCKHLRVLYTRRAFGGRIIRRRECRNCGKRFSTWESPVGSC
jgi:hypothetical protein